MRYKITCDDDGHYYLIPANKSQEVSDYLEALYRHWSEDNYLFEEEPQPPCEMIRINPFTLTFENPEGG